METLVTKIGGMWGRGGDNAGVVTAAAIEMPHHNNRLRAFANEDVYFYRKSFNNAAVERAQDPESAKADWKLLGGSIAAAAVLSAALLPQGYSFLVGREIEQLKHERERLAEQQRELMAEESRLMSPDRMAKLASAQHFAETPGSTLTVYLRGADDAEFASTPTAPNKPAAK
jgi:hypothetical protein